MARFGSKLRSTADGFTFFCPGCREMHAIRVGGACGWSYSGDAENPTFAPSIRVSGVIVDDDGMFVADKVCHSFVRNGRIEFLGDCTHALSGQTVDLHDLPKAD